MPIYEYKCRDCGGAMEVLARSSRSDPELACDHCRSHDLEKMISLPAAVVMGASRSPGKTCCGKDERCDAPPCSSGGTCRRD
jgi:putative FmdB family regulatory protein